MFINRPVPTANTCATVYRSCAGADAAFKSFDAIFCFENDARKVDGKYFGNDFTEYGFYNVCFVLKIDFTVFCDVIWLLVFVPKIRVRYVLT